MIPIVWVMLLYYSGVAMKVEPYPTKASCFAASKDIQEVSSFIQIVCIPRMKTKVD